VAGRLDGSLTATVLADPDDPALDALLPALVAIAGRVVLNGVPTGVAVCDAMHHGGPWPATSNGRYTSVGTGAIERFLRPVALQGLPARLLPPR
jgi:NADP-dependent aldehyde dehydrogenase